MGARRSFRQIPARSSLASALVFVVIVVALLPARGADPLAHEIGTPAVGLATPIPVVMVVFDEFPMVSLLEADGSVDEGLFPNFAALGDTSTWFRNATTVAEFTRGALPAILTGLDPEQALLGLVGNSPPSVFSMLRASHSVRTSKQFPTLCEPSVCAPVGRPRPRGRQLLEAFTGEQRGRLLSGFLDQLRVPEQPCFCLLHMVMPHSPWRYLPTGQRYPGTDPLPGHVDIPGPGRRWLGDRWLVQLGHQRHLLQVAFADRLMGVIRSELERAHLFDEALVVVMADHGIAFTPGLPKRSATRTTAGDIAWVPLFVKAPGQVTPEVVNDPVEVIDVVPTIAESVGLDVGASVDGVSLWRRSPQRRRSLGVVDLASHGDEVERAVARKLETFPGLESWRDLFRLAPEGTGHLLGQAVPGGGEAVGEIVVEDARSIQEADAGDPVIPGLVKGRLAGGGPATLAIALDGRVLAVTRTYRFDGEDRFYGLVPPDAFAGPPHTLQLFRVGDAGELAELTIRGLD